MTYRSEPDAVEAIIRSVCAASGKCGWMPSGPCGWKCDGHDLAIAVASRLSSRIEEVRKEEWRLIADAPVTNRIEVMVWGSQIGVCAGSLHRFEGRSAAVSVSHLGGDAVANWGVTHWMPRPAPPVLSSLPLKG